MESFFGTLLAIDIKLRVLSYGNKVWHGSCKELILKMIIIIIIVGDFENDYHYDNREVYEVKVVLCVGALLSNRCGCFGMVFALIHSRLSKVFATLINTPQKLIIIKFISSVL